MTDAMSNKVMLAARQQLEEVEAGSDDDGGGGGGGPVARPTLGRSLIQATIHEDSDEDEDDEDDPMGAGRDGFGVRAAGAFDDDGDGDDDRAGPKGADDDYYEDIEISPEDEKALSAFMAPKASKERTLADIILEKIKEKESGGRGAGGAGRRRRRRPRARARGIDQKVVDVYRQVGDLLKRYTVGKIPKAFKIIPALSNWEEVLYLTNPEKWSPHAMFQATRLFASNLNAKMAQRFYSLAAAAARQGRHRRAQAAALRAVSGAEEGDVQARGLLQGDTDSPVRLEDVHAEGGCGVVVGAHAGIHPDASLRRGAAEARGAAVRGHHVLLPPRVAGQEVRPAVQGGGRVGGPLPPVPERVQAAAGRLAPVPAVLRAEVQAGDPRRG